MSPIIRSSIIALGITLATPVFAGSFLDSASKALDSASQQAAAQSAGSSPSTTANTNPSLTDLAMNSLGVGNNQATSGLGVLFNMAQQNLTSNQFQTVSQSVPQMSDLLSAGKQAAEQTKSAHSGGLLGQALGMASQVSPTAGTALKAYNTLKGLGFSPQQIGSLINLVTQYLEGSPASSNGTSAADLFQQGVGALSAQPGVSSQ